MEKTYRIKTLEFPDFEIDEHFPQVSRIKVDTIIGRYFIQSYYSGLLVVEFYPNGRYSASFERFNTIDECKSFIQSDYEWRLLPALIEQ